jgi:RNA polymerase sigma factor (sigma-70 family)
MAGIPLRAVVRHLRRLADAGGEAAPTDAQLLDRFADGGDPAAFELLLWRHGAMVFGLCRRVVRHEQDAEDAFQATFLALARKARSVARRASVAGWLHTVAHRAALAARAGAVRRAARSVPLDSYDLQARSAADAEWRDVRPVLDEEIRRLPDRHRLPFVLCHLEGLTLDEAARQLGRPKGTVVTWLARAKARLRKRLTGRGVGLGAAALTLELAADSSAGPPAPLVAATLRAAGSLAGRGAAAVSAPVLALTEGVLHTMFLGHLKSAAAVVAAVVVLGTGVGGLAVHAPAAGDDPPAQRTPDKLPPADPPAKIVAEALEVADVRVALPNWGEIIIPGKDCTVQANGDKLQITLPGTDHALCVEQNRMNAPRVLREVEGDFIAQVKVSGAFPKGARSAVPTRGPFHGAGLLLWQEEKTYVRLERAAVPDGEWTASYVNWELRHRGEFARVGSGDDMTLKDPPAALWLRLERRGAKVHGLVSFDGTNWTALEPIRVALSNKLLVGVVAGHNTSTGFAPTFEALQVFQAK